ncbi:GTP-binding protein LepA [Pseudokineococcus sp. 1T1Z-3]|uniref:GTP-binding protein LepA n=1 Tax=Pseudokineococcus sp. 1T1Z-3 TaxID=3132745 RepID=UPI0030B0A16D
MPRSTITPEQLRAHVLQLGEKHPPISLDSVDRTVLDPAGVREAFGPVIGYLSRVELEVDRNVLELLTLLPDVEETDRLFFADVWQPQEIQHGLVLDRLQQDLGMEPAEPNTTVISPKIRVLGALSHLPPVQEVARLLYYLTGAATERSAVVAYNKLSEGLERMDERAIARTVVAPIKQQEPGHFAYYRLAATQMFQSRALKPWQLRLAQILRRQSFALVGVNQPGQEADYGRVVSTLGLDGDLAGFARDISRVERELLWAGSKGMEVPGYVLGALKDAVAAYRERHASGAGPLPA